MNHLLLVAPGVQPPWTEGRKTFVRDLSHGLRHRGETVEILSGISDRRGRLHEALAPIRACFELIESLSRGHKVDAVIVFPYGRFSGLQGVMNRVFLWFAKAICERKKVTIARLFYSCAGMEFEKLNNLYSPALTVGRGGGNLRQIALSIRHGPEKWVPHRAKPLHFLFLCGYQRALASELSSVLNERGLQDLLNAGKAIVEIGGVLSIAIPFLRHEFMRRMLAQQIARSCPKLTVRMLNEVTAKEILLEHDVFVFPYRSEHAVFTPTSLLEAMSVGIPTIASDHLMYHSLIGNNATCMLYRPGDSGDLSQAIRELSSDYAKAIDQATLSREKVRRNWTIERSTQQLMDFISSLG